MIRRLRAETGTVLATALAALSVMGVLSAGFAATSSQLSNTSDASRDAKRALAAADAGLETALLRLNQQATQQRSMCFTTVFVEAVEGACPQHGPEDIGNGASFSYHVTAVLPEGALCAGVPVTNATTVDGLSTIAQRCVTATGLANREVRRVQARIASYEGAPIFPAQGVLGLQWVTTGNNVDIDGYIGSNGQVTLGTSATVKTVELGPSAPNPITGNGSQIGEVKRRLDDEGNFVVAPIDFGNSADPNHNSNGRILSGLDAKSGNVTYDATTRDLSVNGTLTLGGATYNFCRVTLSNQSQLIIAAGARVRIFLDSPDRTGSGCIPSGMTAHTARQAGYGSMSLGNGATFNNGSSPDALQIYVYGWHASFNTISFNNKAIMRAAVYAPRTLIEFNNTDNSSETEQLRGGMVAGALKFNNNTRFRWDESLASLRAEMVAHYVRTAWSECRREPPNASDPGSGCAIG